MGALVDQMIAARLQGEPDANHGSDLQGLTVLMEGELTSSQRAEAFEAVMTSVLSRVSPCEIQLFQPVPEGRGEATGITSPRGICPRRATGARRSGDAFSSRVAKIPRRHGQGSGRFSFNRGEAERDNAWRQRSRYGYGDAWKRRLAPTVRRWSGSPSPLRSEPRQRPFAESGTAGRLRQT
jgi:hypothetical protein